MTEALKRSALLRPLLRRLARHHKPGSVFGASLLTKRKTPPLQLHLPQRKRQAVLDGAGAMEIEHVTNVVARDTLRQLVAPDLRLVSVTPVGRQGTLRRRVVVPPRERVQLAQQISSSSPFSMKLSLTLAREMLSWIK